MSACPNCCPCCQKADELAREVEAVCGNEANLCLQIVALREWLEREAQHSVGCPSATGCTGFGDPKYLAWKMLPDNEKCTCDWGCALTDTAAVARETERRLRVEGAEAMNAAWHDANCSLTHPEPPAAVVDAATAAGKWGKP